MGGQHDNNDLAMSEQEITEKQQKISKQRSEAGLKGQNALLRKELAERDAHLSEVLNKPEPGQDVPWKHADLPSYLPKCPGGTCGKANPNFPGLAKLAICKNCKHPVGTAQEIKDDMIGGIKGSSCPWCDGKEAIMPEITHD